MKDSNGSAVYLIAVVSSPSWSIPIKRLAPSPTYTLIYDTGVIVMMVLLHSLLFLL